MALWMRVNVAAKSASLISALADADAFVDAHQVRRGVQAGAQAGGFQDAGQHGGGGAFAVGAGDVDGAELLVRIAEMRGEGADVCEVEFGGAGVLGRGQFAAQGEEIADGLVVGHGWLPDQKSRSLTASQSPGG